MSIVNTRGFKQKLSSIARLWEEEEFDAALNEVEAMLKVWPGNAHLLTLWAGLIQLQQNPKHELSEVRQVLQQAVELDRDSPAAALELGHYLDQVEDDPQAALKVFGEGVATARQLLIDGLMGQARTLQQLDRKEESVRCLMEVLHLSQVTADGKRSKTGGTDVIFESPKGNFYAIQLKGPYAEQIQELLSEAVADQETRTK